MGDPNVNGISVEAEQKQEVSADQQGPKLHMTDETRAVFGDASDRFVDLSGVTDSLLIISSDDFVRYLIEEHADQIYLDKYNLGLTQTQISENSNRSKVNYFMQAAFSNDWSLEKIERELQYYSREKSLIADFFEKKFPDFDYEEQANKLSERWELDPKYIDKFGSYVMNKIKRDHNSYLYGGGAVSYHDGNPETQTDIGLVFLGQVSIENLSYDSFIMGHDLASVAGLPYTYFNNKFESEKEFPAMAKLWSVFHELAHIRKNHSDSNDTPQMELEEEVEADRFAAHCFNDTEYDLKTVEKFLDVIDHVRTVKTIVGGHSHVILTDFDSYSGMGNTHATGVLEYGLKRLGGQKRITAEFEKSAMGQADQHMRVGATLNHIAHVLIGKIQQGKNSIAAGKIIQYKTSDFGKVGQKLTRSHPELTYLALKKLRDDGYFPDDTEEKNLADKFLDSFKAVVDRKIFKTEEAIALAEKLKVVDIEKAGFSKVDKVDKETYYRENNINDTAKDLVSFNYTVSQTIKVKF